MKYFQSGRKKSTWLFYIYNRERIYEETDIELITSIIITQWCAIAGACMGFLWHNCEPAKLIMGDTGSLALGGALSLIAIMPGQQILLFIIGGIFIVELASSLIQQIYFRHTGGKRIFLMAPLHHHYEKKGIPDSQITIRFWIIAILFALIGLATLKIR